jgi:hypothetical protein
MILTSPNFLNKIKEITMSRIYKTATGRSLDMDKFRLQNEKEQAIGNMKVNARGDEVDNSNKIVRNRNEIMREHYKNKTGRN